VGRGGRVYQAGRAWVWNKGQIGIDNKTKIDFFAKQCFGQCFFAIYKYNLSFFL